MFLFKCNKMKTFDIYFKKRLSMKLKHNKLKNTAILFELLTQKLTSEIISEKNPIAVNLIKKYFHNTELAKEYSLYESITNSTNLEETVAKLTLNEIEQYYKKLDKVKLGKEKYNLIHEISKNYDTNDFFKSRVSNYKLLGTISILLESFLIDSSYAISEIISNKKIIFEHLTSIPILDEMSQSLREYAKMDKVHRNHVFKIIVDNFNADFSDKLNENQKTILHEYIFSVSSSPKLTESFNVKIRNLKEFFTKHSHKVTDEVILIKLNEIITELKPFNKNYIIKEIDVEKLLHYYELQEEIKNI